MFTKALRIAVIVAALAFFAFPQGSATATSWRVVTMYANFDGGRTTTVRSVLTSIKLPAYAVVRNGYTFTGWAKTASARATIANRATVKVTSSLKLYATWREIPPAAPSVTGHTVGTLLWHDEFRAVAGSGPSTAAWTARTCGYAASNGGGACHNAEEQYYLPSAVAQDGSTDGNAVITTNRISTPPQGYTCGNSTCNFTSARFDTQGKVAFQYGYIEARIQMPAGGRNWPAFWMVGENITQVAWPQSGEIDIAEQGGNTPSRNSGALHYSTNGIANSCCGNHTYDVGAYVGPNYSADFHTYGLAWTPNRIELYVDGLRFVTWTSSTIQSQFWSFNQPFFVILNNAIGGFGGNWSGWTQSQMKIDYVRAWQLDGHGQVFLR